MGCCLCRSKSTITDDPEVFHAEATNLTTVLPGGIGHGHLFEALLYIKNNKLYQVARCGDSGLCCLCGCGYSRKLSNIGDVKVITGTLSVYSHEGQLARSHDINLGLMVTITDWRNCLLTCRTIPVVKIYDTPDAVKLATLLKDHAKGQVATEPVPVSISVRYPGEKGVFYC